MKNGNIDKKFHMDQLMREPELRNLKVLFFLGAFLIIVDYLLPQYFGIHFGYDLTSTRLGVVLIISYFVLNRKAFMLFCKTIYECKLLPIIMVYLFVTGYTMVFRANINAFFMPFMEILTLFLLIYVIRYVVGVELALKWSVGCAWFLGLEGFVEYAYGQSIYHKFLSTLPNNVSNYYRSGQYRIMGPCGHSLGYGLLLVLLIGIVCTDIKKNEVNLFCRPVLLLVLILNVFLTGSRSTLGVMFLELFLIFIFESKENKKQSLFFVFIVVLFLGIFLLLFNNTSIGRYIMMQLASLVDHVLGTSYAVNWGAEVDRLEDSENYRAVLPKIFTLDWLNPFIGRGTKGFSAVIDGVAVHSIDNYYVQQYIKYAYPGMISYIIFIIINLALMIKSCIVHNSGIAKGILISIVCYYVNLWWVDALQTLKYTYIVLAIFYAVYMIQEEISWRNDKG